MNRRIAISVALWTIAFLIALPLDYHLAHWVHTSGLGRQVEGTHWAQVIKEPGNFRFTIVIAILLAVMKQIRPRQAIFVIASGILSGANALVKWLVGRDRPYKFPGSHDPFPFKFRPCGNGLWGLFHQHDLCFPSGHECTAAALAVAILFVWARGAWVFVIFAICVGIERPAENAHYLSDVIGAAGFAMLCTTLLHRLLRRWMMPSAETTTGYP